MKDKKYQNRAVTTGPIARESVQSLTPIRDITLGTKNTRSSSARKTSPAGAHIASQKENSNKAFKLRFVAIILLLLLGIGGGLFTFFNSRENNIDKSNIAQPSKEYDTQSIDLGELASSGSLGLITSQSLSVNGQLRTNNSLVLTPIDRPTEGTVGQLYFDKNDGVMAYYNGSQFIDLAGTNEVSALAARLQGVESRIPVIPTVPSDIATLGANNNFQALNRFSAGISTSDISVNNAATLQGSLTVGGNTTLGATKISSLLLNSPLGVASGGTGTTSLTQNGVVIGQGANPLTAVTAGSAGLCLMSTAGAPSFQACPGGTGSGVSSINGIDGALSIANSTASGATITMNNASTATKGIAQFNASNFSVSSGNVNTIQNIGITAAPTFGGLTVNGNINATNVSATNLSGNGSGVTNVNATQLNGQAASFYQNASNINTGTLADARLSANVTLAGNTFNGANQLVQLDNDAKLPAVDGSLLTSVNAALLQGQSGSYYLNLGNATGTLDIARIADASITNAKLQNTSITITAGTGISGGGAISLGGSAGISLGNTAVSSGGYGSGSSVATFTVDAQGRLTTAGSTSIAIAATRITSGTLAVARGGTGGATSQAAINSISQLTTEGDLLYRNSSSNATRLARGTNGQCLTSTASTIQWGSCGGGGSGWGLTGNASTSMGTNYMGTTDNQGVLIKANNSAPSPSSIQINSSSNDSIGAITISGNGPGGSSGGGTNWFDVKQTGGSTFLGVSGKNTDARVQVYLQAGSNVGANTRVCSTVGVGSNGLGTLASCPSGVDLAEAYNSTEHLEAGDIVVADPNEYPNVLRSSKVAQSSLLGIVSTQPNEVMGRDITPNGYPIALNGRVPTKINSEGGIIKPGDKITSSSVPGVGKKATEAGMTIGTALTGFSGKGQGTIEVFVNLDYYQPTDLEKLQVNNGSFESLNVAGEAQISKLSVNTIKVKGDLTVKGTTTVENIVVNGHIVTKSGQPTSETKNAAGKDAEVSISGTDTTGTITITTGKETSEGALAKFIFSKSYGKTPRVVMSPSNAAASKVQYYKGATSKENFMLNVAGTPAKNTTYTFDYFISE